MVTSPLASLRDSLATEIAALIPIGVVTPSYRHLVGRNSLDPIAASSHRVFWFAPSSGGEITDWGSGLSRVTHRFDLVLCLNHAALSYSQQFTARVSEAMQIIRAINSYTSLPSGVDYCRADGYEIENTDNESALVVITIEAITQESD